MNRISRFLTYYICYNISFNVKRLQDIFLSCFVEDERKYCYLFIKENIHFNKTVHTSIFRFNAKVHLYSVLQSWKYIFLKNSFNRRISEYNCVALNKCYMYVCIIHGNKILFYQNSSFYKCTDENLNKKNWEFLLSL